jgi:membrane protein DedA with SNARE-associated domain
MIGVSIHSLTIVVEPEGYIDVRLERIEKACRVGSDPTAAFTIFSARWIPGYRSLSATKAGTVAVWTLRPA